MDLGTGQVFAIPAGDKKTETVSGFMRWIMRDEPAKRYYCDNGSELVKAAQGAGMIVQTSTPGKPMNNHRAESNNRLLMSGARAASVAAGLPGCFWTYSLPYAACAANISRDVDGATAYERRFGFRFPGEHFPFGNAVYYSPTKTSDKRSKADPRLRLGLFLGWRLTPGGKWNGDYIIADINDFVSRSMRQGL